MNDDCEEGNNPIKQFGDGDVAGTLYIVIIHKAGQMIDRNEFKSCGFMAGQSVF